MGFFSIVSGRVLHFNQVNAPIDHEIRIKIKTLNLSIEKISLDTCFKTSQGMIMGMFDADNGMFKSSIKTLTSEIMKKVWIVLMLACVKQITSVLGNESYYSTSIVEKIFYIFDQYDKFIQETLDLQNSINSEDTVFFVEIWRQICKTINLDPKDEASFLAFVMAFSDLYNINIATAREDFRAYLNQ